ncbi:CEA cell adhesion molecule 20 [Phyllostomus discolor]|uniref:CEA cell adhesion molecule 20 n=1 Tax=Phyllostomus discolor TaxID=89673 RepID=A0A833YPG3_9CHIR|nr:CEA cell adhesion molecule 20 [Phyllostomus discolor]
MDVKLMLNGYLRQKEETAIFGYGKRFAGKEMICDVWCAELKTLRLTKTKPLAHDHRASRHPSKGHLCLGASLRGCQVNSSPNPDRREQAPFIRASLWTAWSLPAATQLDLDATLLNVSLKLPAKPTISVSPGIVTEKAEKVTFRCDTKDINPNIHWVFSNRPLVLHERIHLSPDGRELTISPVLRGDAGSYQCEVWDVQGSQSSNPTYLVVNYGPDPFDIKVEPSAPCGEVVKVIEGSNVTFSAKAQSYPAPTYSWFLPNDSTPSFTERTFHIHAVSREQEGTYRCWANNSATQKSRLAALRVQVLEHTTKPLLMTPNLSVMENANTVPLTCLTIHEGALVQWLLRGQPLLPSKHLVLSEDNRTLFIHPLWRNDTGPYECEVWHGGGWTRSDPLRLTIHCESAPAWTFSCSLPPLLVVLPLATHSTVTGTCSVPGMSGHERDIVPVLEELTRWWGRQTADS